MDALYATLATAVVVTHALWVLWVVVGVLLVKMGGRLKTFHLACVALTLLIFLTRGICPLTDLEGWLNAQAGRADYEGGFLQHYAAAFVYGELIPVAPQQFFVGLLLFTALAILVRFHRKLTF